MYVDNVKKIQMVHVYSAIYCRKPPTSSHNAAFHWLAFGFMQLTVLVTE